MENTPGFGEKGYVSRERSGLDQEATAAANLINRLNAITSNGDPRHLNWGANDSDTQLRAKRHNQSRALSLSAQPAKGHACHVELHSICRRAPTKEQLGLWVLNLRLDREQFGNSRRNRRFGVMDPSRERATEGSTVMTLFIEAPDNNGLLRADSAKIIKATIDNQSDEWSLPRESANSPRRGSITYSEKAITPAAEAEITTRLLYTQELLLSTGRDAVENLV